MVSFKSQLLACAAFFSVANACAADNCYRALFPCPSPSAVAVASSFCATITAGGATATNYPTRATSACGTVPDRYISACKCGPTCAPATTLATSTTTSSCTPTPSNGGQIYGDFECGGLGPWATSTVDSGFAISIKASGLTGKNSVQGEFIGDTACRGQCSSGRILYPVFAVTPGVAYKITYGTWMDPANTDGFIGLMINGNGLRTTDIGDYPQGQWNFIQHPWTAWAGATSANFALEWYGPQARLDTISFAPVAAYCGPNPPVGIMPDGEFECGLGAWTQQVVDPGCVAGVSASSGLIPVGQGIGAFGQYAWQAYSATSPSPANQDSGVSARLVSPAVPVTPGKIYMLAFLAYFSNQNMGFLGIKINGNPVMTRDPGDAGQNTLWFAPNQYFWTAPAGVTTAIVTFEVVQSTAGRMAVDGVIFVEAAQSFT